MLVSKLSRLPVAAIADNHPEVQFLANIPAAALVDQLWRSCTADKSATSTIA